MSEMSWKILFLVKFLMEKDVVALTKFGSKIDELFCPFSNRTFVPQDFSSSVTFRISELIILLF